MTTGLELAVLQRFAESEADPVIAAVGDYWRGLARGALPPRRSFDFMAIYRHAPHLLMAERAADQAFRFVYCGTLVAENFPIDLTGRTFGPDTPRVSKVPWPRMFGGVLDTPGVLYGRMPIDWPNPRHRSIAFGIFPLADDTGAARFALACLCFEEIPRELR
ncbi:MAG: hypothetical protein SFV21_13785 [Rhodospirillaceae bacterium]|nr:hypothetical protein [Rhodospirillaceae bacterium]